MKIESHNLQYGICVEALGKQRKLGITGQRTSKFRLHGVITSSSSHLTRRLSLISLLVLFLDDAHLFIVPCYKAGSLQTLIAVTIQNSSLSQYKIHRCHNYKFIVVTIQNSSLSQYKIHRCHNIKFIAVIIQNSMLSKFQIHRCHNRISIAVTIPSSSLSQYKIHRCHNYKFIAVTIQNPSPSQYKPATDYILSPFF
jgi:hypothetical protein